MPYQIILMMISSLLSVQYHTMVLSLLLISANADEFPMEWIKVFSQTMMKIYGIDKSFQSNNDENL